MTGAIYKALAGVMQDVTAIGKNQKNESQGFRFRGVDDTIAAAGPAFRRHGVLITPEVVSSELDTTVVRGDRGERLVTRAHLTVEYTFHAAEDGSVLVAKVSAEASDYGDKALVKAWSIAYRTALLQVLCVPTGDEEPDAVSYEFVPAASDAQPQQPQRLKKKTGRLSTADLKRKVLTFFDGDTEGAKEFWDRHGEAIQNAADPDSAIVTLATKEAFNVE